MQGAGGLQRLLSLSIFLELSNFSRQLCSIIRFSDKPIFFHEHLDTILLVDHLLLVIHHFHAFSPLMHLLELIGDCNGFASEWHGDFGLLNDDLAGDWMNWGTRPVRASLAHSS